MACTDDADATAAALAATAAGPKRARGDMGEVESQPLADLIEADKYQRAKCAAKSPARGLRFTRLIPPGSV